jgi:hypothetical protein
MVELYIETYLFIETIVKLYMSFDATRSVASSLNVPVQEFEDEIAQRR